MHFGEMLEEDRYQECIRVAYEAGIRTFVTADVYGTGRADKALGEVLADYSRDSYCLVGMLGHDFYEGERQGSSGYPRFTSPALRTAAGYHDFLRKACENSLKDCGTDHFDLLMLHNPDETGYQRRCLEGHGRAEAGGARRTTWNRPGTSQWIHPRYAPCVRELW